MSKSLFPQFQFVGGDRAHAAPANYPGAAAPSKKERMAASLRGLAAGRSGAITLRQLLEYQYQFNASRVRNSNVCTILAAKPVRTKRGNPAWVYVVSDDINGTGRKHRVDISSTNLTAPEKTTHPIVSCSCEDFAFRCEYALAVAWNLSVIRYSNGEPPVETNLGNAPYLCKHVIIATRHLLHHM